MSRIVSPLPVQMTILYNEMNGQVDFKVSRDLPFPLVVMIFSKLMATLCEKGMTMGFPSEPVVKQSENQT